MPSLQYFVECHRIETPHSSTAVAAVSEATVAWGRVICCPSLWCQTRMSPALTAVKLRCLGSLESRFLRVFYLKMVANQLSARELRGRLWGKRCWYRAWVMSWLECSFSYQFGLRLLSSQATQMLAKILERVDQIGDPSKRRQMYHAWAGFILRCPCWSQSLNRNPS